MFNIFKKKAATANKEVSKITEEEPQAEGVEQKQAASDIIDSGHMHENASASSWLGKLKNSLSKTSQAIGEGLSTLILGKKQIDAELLEEIEMRLLGADVGIEAVDEIIKNLTKKLKRNELSHHEILLQTLKAELLAILQPISQPLHIPKQDKPFVIMLIGINGAGKTTSIGKLAWHLQQKGNKVMLAAGDTFRAAAAEQLQAWGQRNNVPVVAQEPGSDSASVIFDALSSAMAKNINVLLADTAGRLHNKDNLMQELKKIKRVLAKLDQQAPQEIMLVLDASIGQNALAQALAFHKEIGVTSLVVTKLDGTAKGGILFAIAKQLNLPIRYIGIGEGIEDLKEFDAQEFVDALFNT